MFRYSERVFQQQKMKYKKKSLEHFGGGKERSEPLKITTKQQ